VLKKLTKVTGKINVMPTFTQPSIALVPKSVKTTMHSCLIPKLSASETAKNRFYENQLHTISPSAQVVLHWFQNTPSAIEISCGFQ